MSNTTTYPYPNLIYLFIWNFHIFIICTYEGETYMSYMHKPHIYTLRKQNNFICWHVLCMCCTYKYVWLSLEITYFNIYAAYIIIYTYTNMVATYTIKNVSYIFVIYVQTQTKQKCLTYYIWSHHVIYKSVAHIYFWYMYNFYSGSFIYVGNLYCYISKHILYMW